MRGRPEAAMVAGDQTTFARAVGTKIDLVYKELRFCLWACHVLYCGNGRRKCAMLGVLNVKLRCSISAVALSSPQVNWDSGR
jgi:hypothetical protein